MSVATCLTGYGVELNLRCSDPELLAEAVAAVQVPGSHRGPARDESGYSLALPGESEFYTAALDGRHCLADRDRERFLEAFERDFHIELALRSPLLFLHAGAVAWNGEAYLFPGASTVGKSSLVEALVDAGARYLSDEFAVLDREGRVHPFPRPLALRGRGRRRPDHPQAEPVTKIALVGCLAYREGPALEVTEMSVGTASLELFRHAVNAPNLGSEALSVCARVAQASRQRLQGFRGDARQTAEHLLSSR